MRVLVRRRASSWITICEDCGWFKTRTILVRGNGPHSTWRFALESADHHARQEHTR